MAAAFQAVGSQAVNATTTTLGIVAPTLAADDIMIAVVHHKGTQTISPPDGTWTGVADIASGSMGLWVFWKRAASGDSGATFNFTKPTDDNVLFSGIIAAYRGCPTSGDPLVSGTPSEVINAVSDTVTYNDFSPGEACLIVAVAAYNNDETTAGAMSGTDPTFTNRWDVETTGGTDDSLFGYDGTSSGATTGSRTHSTTSVNDAASAAIMFGLKSAGSAQPPRTMSLFRQRRIA